MPRIRSLLVNAGPAVVLAACAHSSHPPGVGGARGSGTPAPAALPSPAGQPASAQSTANMSLKRVAGKEEPATLIAVDRSECTVTSDRFRSTRVGDHVLCDWRVGDRKP